MKMNISDRKNLADGGFISRAEKKLAKLDRYFGADCSASVKLSQERQAYVVEVTLNGPAGSFRAQERSDNSYLALDSSVDAIIRQIRKHRTKLEKQLRSNAFDEVEPLAEEVQEDNLSIVRKKHYTLKPMTEEDAALNMDLLGHSFFAFRNAEADGQISIVYKRTDGGYGLIELE